MTLSLYTHVSTAQCSRYSNCCVSELRTKPFSLATTLFFVENMTYESRSRTSAFQYVCVCFLACVSV